MSVHVTTDSVSSFGSADGYSSVRCKGVSVTNVGNTGMAAGIVHLSPGTFIGVTSKTGSCTKGKTTRTCTVSNGDIVNIRTEQTSRTGDCPASYTSEVIVGDLHVSSTGFNGSMGVRSLSRRHTAHNVRIGSPGENYPTSKLYQRRSNSDLQSSNWPHHQSSTRDNEVSSKMTSFIAINLGSDWRALGTKIGFSFEDLDLFSLDHGHLGIKECCYQMLSSWKQRRGRTATKEVLLKALTDIDRRDIALRLPS